MKRHYTTKRYSAIINKLRSRNERFSFTTDIIVGFPGETEREFEETCDFVREMEFLKVHVFRFSPRPDTEAFSMKNKVSGTVKKNRSRVLREIAEKSSQNYLKAQEGKKSTVLVETTNHGFSMGYDEYYIQHRIKGIHTEGFVRVQMQKSERSGAFSNAELCCESVEV
jgi:threonylcarbamoyladenosine tRNA methylthiotransferase MtaB